MTGTIPNRRPRTPGRATAVIAALALAAAPMAGRAQDFAPVVPQGASVSADRSDPAQLFDVAVGTATATAPPPVLGLAGPRRQIAYQAAPGPAAALKLMDDLREQLVAADFRTVFSCADIGCGGFDFRRARPVLPMPAMYVDLSSFSYLAARKDGPGGRAAAPVALASILVSQSATTAFAQLTLITDPPAGPTAGATAPVAVPGAGTASAGSTSRPLPRPLPGATAVAPAVPPAAPAATTAAASPTVTDWTADAVAAAFAATGRLVLEGTDFATGSTTILGDPTPRVRALADWLTADPKRRVAVVGHSDWTGSVEANLKVSRARAAAVAQQLASLGVPAARIRVDGVGPLAPLAPNGDPAGLQANRRVEVVQLPDGS